MITRIKRKHNIANIKWHSNYGLIPNAIVHVKCGHTNTNVYPFDIPTYPPFSPKDELRSMARFLQVLVEPERVGDNEVQDLDYHLHRNLHGSPFHQELQRPQHRCRHYPNYLSTLHRYSSLSWFSMAISSFGGLWMCFLKEQEIDGYDEQF